MFDSSAVEESTAGKNRLRSPGYHMVLRYLNIFQMNDKASINRPKTTYNHAPRCICGAISILAISLIDCISPVTSPTSPLANPNSRAHRAKPPPNAFDVSSQTLLRTVIFDITDSTHCDNTAGGLLTTNHTTKH